MATPWFTGATGVGSQMMDAQRNFYGPAAYGLLGLMGLVGILLPTFFAKLEGVIERRWPVA